MRHKHIWAWIACLALLVCSLSACSLFGRDKDGETAAPGQTAEPSAEVSASPAPSATVIGSPEPAQGAEQSPEQSPEQSTSVPTPDHAKEANPNDTAAPFSGTELPEIEIPVASDQVDPQTENTPMPEQEPESTPVPEQESGMHDITIDQNGDILLPEVP